MAAETRRFKSSQRIELGSAVLETLYKEMCGATRPNKAKIEGCLSLLQSWARSRFPFLHPQVDHPYTFPLITRWNHSASYVRLPTCLEDIWLLLDQRSEAEFQSTLYEDPAIRVVISDEFFQNPNVWHVKVPLVNYATVEIHKSDKVLQQFRFRQPIPVAPEVFDDEYKVDLRFWSHYIKMWENRYDYIPIREPIIVPELACVVEYMPWFRIHGKPYLLSEEERRRQIRSQRERRGLLNPRRRDDDASPSTAPTQSSGPTVQRTTPTSQAFQIMPDAYPSPYMYPNPYMFLFPSPMASWNPWPESSSFPITPCPPSIYRLPSYEGLHEALSGSSYFYQSPLPYEIQTPPPWVTQTPPQSLFCQDPLPEESQPSPKTDRIRNPVRTRRRPPCGTNFDRHGYLFF
ncbi:hypothetical protein PVK06_033687 [Gossypium arboreum]|uniref:Aminotransferase-like plant mobile domain-containing protein n=1 Tax=Gossypium arboreum TaxID=29729 RepID=A0ABR0NCZ2_GOSAR|nr:hypothetical protein PVK06_033687 [Gossypium arboreum]